MTSLRKLQQNFISDCLSGELNNDNILMRSDLVESTISAKGRMGIYRESSIGNITIPLQMTYPVIEDLVGEEFFSAMCREYIKSNFPVSGDMNDYGSQMAEFIEIFEPTKSLAYLPDMARLEWLFHLSSLADDKDASNWSGFADLSEAELSKVTINLHPSVQIMTSNHPILKIWEMCKESGKAFDPAKESGDNVLLMRKNLKVNLYPLADNETVFLRSIIAGYTLFNAYDKALGIGNDTAMQGFIAKHIDIGTFCGYG